MQKRRIRTGLFFLMIVLLFVLTGCSSSSSDSQGKAKILMSVSDASDTFRASLAKAAKEAADEKGITLEVMDAKSSVDTQVAQMKQAVHQCLSALPKGTFHQMEKQLFIRCFYLSLRQNL